jgi:hypothetical protein
MMVAQRYVGLDLAPLPYESLRSAASRFAWRNGIAHGALKRLYNSILMESETARMPGRMTDHFALQLLTGWTVSGRDEIDFYRKYVNSGFDELAGTLRFCPICLEECYHSYLFQWTALHCCPIHGCKLEMRCNACGCEIDETVLSDAIGQLGYRCSRCTGPIAGSEPNLALHLTLRAQVPLLQARLGYWNGHLKALYEKSHSIRAVRAILALQNRGSPGTWGNKDAILRALQEIVFNEGASYGVANVLGITFIRWRINPSEHRYHSASSTWRERMRGLRPVYIATCRAIENWLFQGKIVRDEVERVCARFVLSGRAVRTDDWNPLELAYVLLRFTQEGQGLSDRSRANERAQVQLRDAPLIFPHWDSGGRMPRIAYRAWLLAAFGTLNALVKKQIGTPIDQILQLPQFPAPIIPSYVEDTPYPLCLTGGVFFPTIVGMPLWPFNRRVGKEDAMRHAQERIRFWTAKRRVTFSTAELMGCHTKIKRWTQRLRALEQHMPQFRDETV